LVVASDGIWDRFTNEEIAKTVLSDQFVNDPEGAASYLVKEAS
jgi:serine/threonine protein phosphatase PrpC